jgi:hypothetical protein
MGRTESGLKATKRLNEKTPRPRRFVRRREVSLDEGATYLSWGGASPERGR